MMVTYLFNLKMPMLGANKLNTPTLYSLILIEVRNK